MKKLCLSLVLGAVFGGAQAQDELKAWLPASEQVQAIVKTSHGILAAQSQQAAQVQRARATELGPAEFNLRMSQQQRKSFDPSSRFQEQLVSLERPVRWWGKAGLDAGLAEQGRQVARIAYADALHEASRELMRQWFALHQLALARDGATAQAALSQELHRQAQLRLKQGDISQLDASLAQAELQRAQAAQAVAQAQWTAAWAQVQKRYPGLPEPVWPKAQGDVADLPALQPLMQTFLQNHHELNLRRAEVQRLRLQAERLDRDRLPDPVLGVYAARERAGAESIMGVSVAFALPGSARQAHAAAALAEANQLEEQLQQMTLELGAAFEARWLSLQMQRQALSGLQAAARTQTQAVQQSTKAFAMGEHSMTELIQNRRLAQESLRESQKLQLELVESWALMSLDLHRIWDFDE
jgi:outer membrane protein, heavy metal efflux system